MGGGGGTTGSVRFPLYIEDLHAYWFASEETDQSGGWNNTNWDKPTLSVTSTFNNLITAGNPFTTFSWSDPATDLAANAAQYALYAGAITTYDRDNYASYISDAILAIGNSTTVPISDLTVALSTSALSTPQTLFTSFATTARNEAALNLTAMFTNVQADVRSLIVDAPSTALAAASVGGSTTLWDTMVDTVSTKLQTCGIPKNANLMTVLSQAANDADTQLRAAVELTKQFIADDLISAVVTQFAARREITYASQVRQYSGTMADINAINSTGFLFGVSLLRAEQAREVAEFDAQLSLAQFTEGLKQYATMHNAALQAGVAIEQGNQQAHNDLLAASITLLTQLSIRNEITGKDLLALYGEFFAQELGMYDRSIQGSQGVQNNLFGITSGDQLSRDSALSKLTYDADRVNKITKEQRYALGMGQIMSIMANKTEFERMSTELLTEMNRVKIVAEREYDGAINDTALEESHWELNVTRQAIDMLVAPGGMGAAIPNKPSQAASALGGGLKGAAAGFAVGGPPGAIAGAVIGTVGGLLQ